MTYTGEISPMEMRGAMIYLGGVFWLVGELYASFASFVTLESAQSGNWRSLLIIVA